MAVDTVHRLLSAAGSVNATLVKSSATSLHGVLGHNARTSAVYLKLYNSAEAVDETDTPLMTIYLPASSAFALGASFFGERGVRFGSGLAYRMTTAGADNSTAALTAGDILALNLVYD